MSSKGRKFSKLGALDDIIKHQLTSLQQGSSGSRRMNDVIFECTTNERSWTLEAALAKVTAGSI